jgi:hypothetical protein
VCVGVHVKNMRLITRGWVCVDNYARLSICHVDLTVYVRMYALVHGFMFVCVCVSVCVCLCV